MRADEPLAEAGIIAEAGITAAAGITPCSILSLKAARAK